MARTVVPLTDPLPASAPDLRAEAVVPVFLSDSTGISAKTMGNTLLIQFPDLRFERTLIPFISTVEQGRDVVTQLDALMAGPVTPLVFITAAVDEVRGELLKTKAPIIYFFGSTGAGWGSRAVSGGGGLSRSDWVKGVTYTLAFTAVGVVGPNVVGSDKNSPYAFEPRQMGRYDTAPATALVIE